MSTGAYISEPMNGRNTVHVSVDGSVTIKVSDDGALHVRSHHSIVIEGTKYSLWVKSPKSSSDHIVASGSRSVAANSVTGVVTTGDNAVVNGQSPEPLSPGESVFIKVPRGTEVNVLRADHLYDRTDDTITVEDGRE